MRNAYCKPLLEVHPHFWYKILETKCGYLFAALKGVKIVYNQTAVPPCYATVLCIARE